MVYEILRIGKENAIKSDELCKKLDVTKRYLQKAIRREREAGKPICASYKKPFGYYIAANKQELREFCKVLFVNASEIFKTRRECIKMLEHFENEEETPAKNN